MRTATFETLTKQSVEHGSAVVAERRRHVVVDGEVMRNVDVEPSCQHLQPTHNRRPAAVRFTRVFHNSHRTEVKWTRAHCSDHFCQFGFGERRLIHDLLFLPISTIESTVS